MYDLFIDIAANAINEHPARFMMTFLAFAVLFTALVGEISKRIWRKR